MSKSKRRKALIAAGIAFFTIPGLHRLYLGDTIVGRLLIIPFFCLFAFWWSEPTRNFVMIPTVCLYWIALTVTAIDFIRFWRMSDREFDTKYTTITFHRNPVYRDPVYWFQGFSSLAVMIGGAGLFFKDRVLCFPEVLVRPCILLTEGDNILNAKGVEISRELASAIQNFSPYLLGFGGIFLLGSILKYGIRTP